MAERRTLECAVESYGICTVERKVPPEDNPTAINAAVANGAQSASLNVSTGNFPLKDGARETLFE
jgi:hypothetical protein